MNPRASVSDEQSTFTVKCGPLKRGSGYHRHNDIEIILIENGSADYLLGGKCNTIRENRFAIFWGSMPHQAIKVDNENTIIYWIHLPLSRFLQWEMPKAMTNPLMLGKIILEDRPEDPAADLKLVKRWCQEWKTHSPAMHKIIQLEIQSRFCRLAMNMKPAPANPLTGAAQGTVKGHQKGLQVMDYITAHYTEPLTSQDIAQAVGLDADYAANLFQKNFGTTLIKFLTQLRLAHAQRLLVTTEEKILEIALESGFGSESRFYAVFKRQCGQTPLQYRYGQQRSLTAPLN